MNALKSGYVMVVDDEVVICDLIECVLGDEGYAVTSCTDPAVALGLAVQRPPALILLDFRMPTMDGETFVRAYRAMTNVTAPIVIFSALPNAGAQAARLGAAGWISKPFDLDDLFFAVSQAAARRGKAA